MQPVQKERLDLRPLGWTRAAVGALILLRTTPLLAPLDIWFLRDAMPLLGWPQAGFSSATLPHSLIMALCLLRTVSAALLMLGVWTRAAGLVCGICGYVVVIQHPFGFFLTIHLLYQAAILLALTDSGTAFALRPVPARSPSSSYWLVWLFTASIYLWAGLFKLRPDWLDGRTLELFRRPGALHGPFSDLLLATPLARQIVATATALFEVTIGPLLLWPRTRRFALPCAFLFHLGLELSAHPDLLGFGMAALLLSFLKP
jgi:uncharacterized membrane protein YphA (DoxX/SURF4 family)